MSRAALAPLGGTLGEFLGEYRMHHSPQSEDLGDGYGSSSLVLHDPSNASKAVGCYSPCAKLTYSQWGQARITWAFAYHRISAVLLHVHAIYRHSTYKHSHISPQGYGNTPESDDAAPYCCPTPPVEPDQCSSGAVTKTAYVRDEIR